MPVNSNAANVPASTIVEPPWSDATLGSPVNVVDWLEVQGAVVSIVRRVICDGTTCISS